MFNSLVIDSTRSRTELCNLGAKFGTDKSPYNTTSESYHKHPYTAVYDMLFNSLRYKNINFGEMGILNNRSMQCWREYFPNANLFGWDFDENLLSNAKSHKLYRTKYAFMDIYKVESIVNGLEEANCIFDILIDDTTHQFDDQIRIANVVHKYLAPGSFFVIEDIFRNIPEERYKDSLSNLKKYYQNITFITTEHANRDSTGWDNDKLIVFVRNNIK